MPAGTLIIRADAGVAMGTGHVMRCIALAQAWQDEARQTQTSPHQGGQCIFAMAETTPASEQRVRGEKFEVAAVAAAPGSMQDAALLVELALARGADWVVLDGYQFDVDYQRQVKAAGLKLLVVDDTAHAGSYVADLVLDQNAHAAEDLYQRREVHTRLLLGPRYALLRREFKSWRKWKREIAPNARQVLVTVGGADPDNLTVRIIRGLRMLAEDKLQATVVVGGSNPHGDSLEAEVQGGGGAIKLVKNASNMPELMAHADVAVSGAGTTCWELCFLGLPALLIDVAENQTPLARELERQGLAVHVGSGHTVTPEDIVAHLKPLLASLERRLAISERGRKLVDGMGSDRVVSAMQPTALQFRAARNDDVRLLWEWANDPGTRAASFSPEAIPWEKHQAWFEDRIKDPNCLILIAENSAGRPVGQIRLDLRSDREGEIHVTMSPDSRGRGLGSRVVDLGVRKAFALTGADCLHAFIRPENQASVRAFERAHFLRRGEDIVKSQLALHYYRARNSQGHGW